MISFKYAQKVEIYSCVPLLIVTAMTSIHCPQNSMYDEKLHITLSGLPKDKLLTIHASTIIDNGSMFESIGQYKSDSQGYIDLGKQESLGGTFTGLESMGLFWSMQQSLSNKYDNTRFVKLDVTTPLKVTIAVYNIVINNLLEMFKLKQENVEMDRFKLASVCINRWLMAKNTKRIPLTVKTHGIHGFLFIPEGPGPFPGVVVMFGGYPGTLEFKAALLSSHGFVTLALAFYGEEGLPGDIFMQPDTDKLHLEYFEHAVDYLCNHKMVESSCGIGIVSLSFSTAVALTLAEYCKAVTCVIWVNGSFQPTMCNIYYKDTVISRMIAFTTDIPGETRLRRFLKNITAVKNRNGDWVTSDGYVFNFQHQHNVAYMFIGSLNDESILAEHCVNWAERLLKDAKHPNYCILRCPGAGHLLEPPYGIHNRITTMAGVYTLDWGGISVPHCKAQEASWKPQIDFLRKNLTRSLAKL